MCGSADGVGKTARFYKPSGIATDGTNLYVTDTLNHTIRSIVIATGTVTTIAGGLEGNADGTGTAASFSIPYGITTDGANLYVTDTANNNIRKIVIATGAVTTIAGAGPRGYLNGVGTAAFFNTPMGIATDGTNLFVADSNNQSIRKVVIATGAVTTMAGSSIYGFSDGTGAAASFRYPVAITIDGTNLYVSDSLNYAIRKIDIPSSTVTTFFSKPYILNGVNDFTPNGITSDGTNIYGVNDSYETVFKVEIRTATLTLLAGKARPYGDLDGVGTTASFDLPQGMTTDGTNLFTVDFGAYTVRKTEIATGIVTTVAGKAGADDLTDGTGSAARFFSPDAITTDGTNLYLLDFNNLRKVVISTGAVTTLTWLGHGDGGITTDGTNLYVTNYFSHTILKINIATLATSTVAGMAGQAGSADGTGGAASFNTPWGITTDGTNLYVADTGNHTIRKVVIATGVVTTLAGTAGVDGHSDGTGATASFHYAQWITTDGTNLYVTDGNHTVRKVVIATGAVTTIAGTADSAGHNDDVGMAASFNSPTGITTDGTNLFLTDSANGTIRKIH